jgi:putative FmdB family regulatory protein
MPIYDYACQACGYQVEVTHGVHDAGPSQCPVCGGAMRKLLSRPAIVFKGSGWAKKERAASAGRAGTSAGAGSREAEHSVKEVGKTSADTAAKGSDKAAEGGAAAAGD